MDGQYNTVLEDREGRNKLHNADSTAIVGSGHRSDFCGWRSFTPKNIQTFASSRWLLVVICLFVFIQNIVTNGFVNVSITTLERQFDLSSSQAALISGGYDAGAGLGVVPVSYYFANRHKGKALTAGLILYGVGSLLFSSPQLFAPKYSYNEEHFSSKQFCSNESYASCSSEDNREESLSNYLYVFIAAQFIMGLAATPLYTIGLTYLDENVKHSAIGAYIGIVLMMSILASAIGFVIGGIILESVYVDFLTGGSPVDNGEDEWMGAWWLGFLVSAILALLTAIPMSCFPKYLPGYEEKHREKMKAIHEGRFSDELLLSNRADFGKWKHLPGATIELIKNPTYMFVTLGNCSQGVILTGIVVFFPKFLEVIYLLSPGTAASVTGLIGTTFGACATLFAGWALRKWKMDITDMLKMTIMAAIISTALYFAFFLNCPEPPFAGLSEPYDQLLKSNVELRSDCNSGCLCSETDFNAVCGSDGRVYFDACYAGCAIHNNESKIYYNCSCVPDDVHMLGSASDGTCDTKTCAQLYIFLLLACIIVIGIFMPGPACDTVTLRCVSNDQRALALALQWLLIRCLGTIPGPFVFGSLFDVTCILWNKTCDGEQGRCYRYDREKLGLLFFGCSLGFSLLSIVLYGVSYYSTKKEEAKKAEANLGTTSNSISENIQL